jgi:hypothetical protein
MGRRRLTPFVLMGVVLALAGLSQTAAGRSVLHGLGLYENPASYTSLYFGDPDSLPERLESEQATVNIYFIVRNASDKPQAYRWSILVERNGKLQKAISDNVQVSSGHATAISRSVTATCTGGRLNFIVSLASPVLSIGFWSDCSPGNARTP